MPRLTRLLASQMVSPVPILPILFCLFVVPAIPPTTVGHAVATYCVLLVAFWTSRVYGPAFVRLYGKHPFLTEMGVCLLGIVAVGSRVRFPGVLEYLSFAAGGAAVGVWFWMHWDDTLFEMMDDCLLRRGS